MGGYSGKTTAASTPIVLLNGTPLAVTPAQHRLIARAIAKGGSTHVKATEVRTARALSLFGDLLDDGSLDGKGNPDGERWTFTTKAGVTL